MASLSLKNLSLTYPNGARALDGIDLEIEDGEFLAVLGPSGCGKSSLLRLVAGLEVPTSGYIDMDGRDITPLEPKERDVAMVFQGLALYPHMTVRENMAFGLMARRTPPEETAQRVNEAAATLGLTPHLRKRPRELSGGERQRVALGRALVRRPRLYLFDEPLWSLDAQLRQELREELARLHSLTRTTSIYVTHDQKEALSLGHRVAVLDRGRVRQIGTPEAIYREPRDLFVARFVGDPAINLIEGEVATDNGRAAFRAPRCASIPMCSRRPECIFAAHAPSRARASPSREDRLHDRCSVPSPSSNLALVFLRVPPSRVPRRTGACHREHTREGQEQRGDLSEPDPAYGGQDRRRGQDSRRRRRGGEAAQRAAPRERGNPPRQARHVGAGLRRDRDGVRLRRSEPHREDTRRRRRDALLGNVVDRHREGSRRQGGHGREADAAPRRPLAAPLSACTPRPPCGSRPLRERSSRSCRTWIAGSGAFHTTATSGS